MTAALRLILPPIGTGIAFLLALIGLNWWLGPNFPLIVAAELLILPALSWAVVGFFAARAVERPDVLTLQIRVRDAVYLALVQTVGAILAAIVVLRAREIIPPVNRDVFTIGLAFCLSMAAGPAANWLLTWRPWRRESVA